MDQQRAGVFYWTAPWARGRGVARRALALLVRWAFARLGMERIELQADADNPGSQAVAHAVGFEREGLLRAYRPRDGARQDSVLFSLLPTDLDRPD